MNEGKTRPSHKELTGKIKDAQEALCKCEGLFADPAKAVGELNELDLGHSAEVWPLIQTLLDEVSPDDYSGHFPPQKSYEATIQDEELFAFAWDSTHLSRRMYLKFALRKGRFYYVSLHKERPEKKGGKQ